MAPHGIGRVVIAVLTFKRTDALLELLPMLRTQIATADVSAEILVVDNDPDAAARQPVESCGVAGVRYVHEPVPGISAGRNRALDESGDAHLLIFIDDDERPGDTWLTSLLDTYRSAGSAAVVGPIVPDYEIVPDPWIVAGGFFVRPMFVSGTEQPAASTANLLLDLRQIERAGHLRFDARFGLSGGSDTLFSRQLVGAGGRILWNSDAGVVDKVPAARLSRGWVTNRAYRSGNSWSRAALALEHRPARVLVMRFGLSVQAVARVGVGAARMLLGRVTGSQVHDARGTRMLARGRGMWAGAWGRVYTEYKRDAVA